LIYFSNKIIKINYSVKELILAALDEQIGTRLKIARQSLGWKTALSFCNNTGIHQSTYSQHEKGHRSLTAASLHKYGELLDVEPSWLLTGRGHPCPSSKDSHSRKEMIDNEVKKFQSKNILPLMKEPSVSKLDKSAVINMEILCKVLVPVMEVLNTKKILCDTHELITFCLDVYNHAATARGSMSEKENLIHLSINSMIKGSTISLQRGREIMTN
jgi:transcriptional regulator with XRE-family HTH domain